MFACCMLACLLACCTLWRSIGVVRVSFLFSLRCWSPSRRWIDDAAAAVCTMSEEDPSVDRHSVEYCKHAHSVLEWNEIVYVKCDFSCSCSSLFFIWSVIRTPTCSCDCLACSYGMEFVLHGVQQEWSLKWKWLFMCCCWCNCCTPIGVVLTSGRVVKTCCSKL